MKKRLFLIHTVQQFMDMIYNPFAKPFIEEHKDKVEVFNIYDGSLLPDTVKNGGVTNEVAARVLNYVFAAEKAGADAVMVTCTSVNKATSYAKKLASIPVFNIEEPMIKKAVSTGHKIGVLGTLDTSPLAIVKGLENEAKLKGKSIDIVTKVANGAFEAVASGDTKKHDDLVAGAMEELSREVDIITFAQASMSRVNTDNLSVPVLKIGKSGFDEASKILFED